MKSRNGISKDFKICITDDLGVETNLTFSFKHQHLKYFIDEKYAYATTISGADKQKFLYAHHYFEISWSELIAGEDADKLVQVINAERLGHKIELMPHTDLPSVLYEVIRVKDSSGMTERMEFSQTINHRNSLGNKGVVLNYKTKNPSQSWEIYDPSNQQGILSSRIQRITA